LLLDEIPVHPTKKAITSGVIMVKRATETRVDDLASACAFRAEGPFLSFRNEDSVRGKRLATLQIHEPNLFIANDSLCPDKENARPPKALISSLHLRIEKIS
jgi:hypothetical protein